MQPQIVEALNAFERHLYLPDPGPLYFVAAVVAANRLEGDAVWGGLVAPPGAGKSELLNAFADLADVHPVATLTEPALLSGTPGKEREEGSKGGLLRAIGDFGIILCKDFGSVLSMNRDARALVLAALREIYDGSWTRHVGTGGGKSLHWSGKVGLIFGCTPTIDRHHAVMGAMGERFIFYRLPEVDSCRHAHRALAHAGHEPRMRKELSAAIATLFAGGLLEPAPRSVDDDDRLVSLATLVVRARSAVERDSYRREIELIPGSEAPTRLVVVLARLLEGLDAIGVDRAQGWKVVTKAALDSIPAIRRDVMNVLSSCTERVDTTAVGETVNYPTTTARRALEDLEAHGIAERRSAGKGKADLWTLTAFARRQYAAVTGVPEMSTSLYLSHPVYDDKTETPSLGAAR